MVQKSGVNVHIGSEFDAKGFKKAQTALGKLSSSAKKLAGAVGLAYGAKALVAYGKASMKAAADDQKAQKILANNLKNVGLAYASVDAESFISSMEKQTAILDDQLRPAYAQLAQTTGSVTKTQELMALAFDVSSGSGLDYSTTVDILTQAYVGNTKGLKQLNLGLTQAELKTMSFAQIQEKLKANFAGAGGASLDSYAGSMAKLSVATNNASETIGTALLDAIIKVSGSNGVDGLISKIDTLAKSFASVVTQIGNAVSALTGTAAQKAFSPGYYVSGGRAGGKTVAPTGAGNMAMSVLSQDTQKSDLAAKKKAELDAAKRAKALLALQNKQLAATKASTKLSEAQAKFGLKAISIAAALRGTYDKETILRLQALQAIEENNGELALKYLSQLDALQKSNTAAKLGGIQTVNNATLDALNQQLLTEIKNINETKLAQSEKDRLIQVAFGKYNEALTAAGGLAAANSYSERVQTQLNLIAKEAALHEGANTELVLIKILESEQMDSIKRVSTAQALADAARLKALQDYINLLKTVGSYGGGGGGGNNNNNNNNNGDTTGTTTTTTKTTLFPKSDLTGDLVDTITNETGLAASADALAEYIDAATARANASADLLDMENKANAEAFANSALGKLSAQYAAEAAAAAASAALSAYAGGAVKGSGQGAGSGEGQIPNAAYSITINTGVISDPNAFIGLLQDGILQLNRRGNNLTTAGAL